jgi:hypothetical protein
MFAGAAPGEDMLIYRGCGIDSSYFEGEDRMFLGSMDCSRLGIVKREGYMKEGGDHTTAFVLRAGGMLDGREEVSVSRQDPPADAQRFVLTQRVPQLCLAMPVAFSLPGITHWACACTV